MSNNDDYFWCGFEARESKSIIIEYVVLFAQLVIFALLIYARLKAKRQKQLEQLSVVYKLIIAWLICIPSDIQASFSRLSSTSSPTSLTYSKVLSMSTTTKTTAIPRTNK